MRNNLVDKEQKFPPWIKRRVSINKNFMETNKILQELNLNTVCQSAACPNIGECFSRGTATFMILGNTCTRNCRFCAVRNGKPELLDESEPERVAKAVQEMGLVHVVITSVTRDDLKDGGAGQFSKTVKMIRRLKPDTIIEILTPDFKMNLNALNIIKKARPDIFNHNLETIPRLYDKVRPQAGYKRSLEVLKIIKENSSNIYTKSGIMVGLGEDEEEVIQVMKDLRSVNCDILTIGQYLQPGGDYLPVNKYVVPEQFVKYKKIGLEFGFKYIASGSFVRSSFQADDVSSFLDFCSER